MEACLRKSCEKEEGCAWGFSGEFGALESHGQAGFVKLDERVLSGKMEESEGRVEEPADSLRNGPAHVGIW